MPRRGTTKATMSVSNLVASAIAMLLTLPCARARGGLPPALFSLRAGTSNSSNSTIDETHFKVLSQSKVYDGKYRQIISKRVKFPNNGKTNEFEVLSNHGLPSVSCFCWDVKNKCTTLVKVSKIPGIPPDAVVCSFPMVRFLIQHIRQ
jgi:hypothetical protein